MHQSTIMECIFVKQCNSATESYTYDYTTQIHVVRLLCIRNNKSLIDVHICVKCVYHLQYYHKQTVTTRNFNWNCSQDSKYECVLCVNAIYTNLGTKLITRAQTTSMLTSDLEEILIRFFYFNFSLPMLN